MNKTRNRPQIKTPCVADHYTSGPERIAEVFDPETKLGCLVSVRRLDDGTVHVSVYRIGAGVRVSVSKEIGGAA